MNYNDAFEEVRGFRFDGDGERLMIWANQPIFNVSLIALGHDAVDDEWRFFATEAVFHVDTLDSTEALVIDSYYDVGTLPLSGLSFEDASGTRRYFFLQQSGYDGSFFLQEFAPSMGHWFTELHHQGLSCCLIKALKKGLSCLEKSKAVPFL